METPIIVGLIAGFVSFIGLIITKEQKISEFRQDWINKLRDDIASLIGSASEFYHAWLVAVKEKKDKNFGAQFLKDKVSVVKDITSIAARCRLRLNPKKDQTMIQILTEVEEHASSPRKLESDNFAEVINKLEKESHEVFKTEWERVKRGELFFVVMKWLLGAFVVAWLIASSISYFKSQLKDPSGKPAEVANGNCDKKSEQQQQKLPTSNQEHGK